MRKTGHLFVGDEPLPFDMTAIELVGLRDGDAMTSMELYQKLIDAERAILDASRSLYSVSCESLQGAA